MLTLKKSAFVVLAVLGLVAAIVPASHLVTEISSNSQAEFQFANEGSNNGGG